ncbi:TIGR01777 family oxidoreductase [Maribacter sp. 2307ULW6-5]|uniref:TIGR01777 family oxidoreductase n=1 Tax=Maribacter sp. 2307ULW6-5 TaxID=3386275 RepID=UPI0039BCB751
MKVLVTGATGLVGSSIVAVCREKGYEVNYLTTRREKIKNEVGYRGFFWNPAKGEMDTACLEGVQMVINLAGASISQRWTATNRKVILDSRIDSLRTLRKGMGAAGHTVTSVVSASAIGIYPSSLEKFYEEDAPGVDNSFLGEVVEAWEKEADTLALPGVKVAKVRIGLVMSANGGALPEMARPIKYFAGAAFGHGNQWQSWIHVKDLARMFLFIGENALDGVYNGVAPNPVTNSKLVKKIAEVLSKPLFLPNVPKAIMQLVLGDMSYILFASQRVSSKKIEEEGFVFDHYNICSALNEIYGKADASKPVKTDLDREFIS